MPAHAGASSGKPASYGGGSSFGNRRRNFRSGGGKPKARFGGGTKIHHSRFICKADPIVESAPFIPKNKFKDFKIDERLKHNITQKEAEEILIKGFCQEIISLLPLFYVNEEIGK